MSTLFVAAILVGITAAVFLFLVSLDKKRKRKAFHQLLRTFHRMGAEQQLNFSGQEILDNAVLGLDGQHRKLLVLERGGEKGFHSFVIDLNDVKSCSVKKEYGTLNGGGPKAPGPEPYLRSVALHFAQFDKPARDVVFYKHFENNRRQIPELEHRARHWEAILSKMIMPVRKIA